MHHLSLSNSHIQILFIKRGAHDSGADVLIISKSKKGDPHTVLATGGINGALATMNPNDSWMIHAADTLKEGCFLADS